MINISSTWSASYVCTNLHNSTMTSLTADPRSYTRPSKPN